MGLRYFDDLFGPTSSDTSRNSSLDGLPVPTVEHGASRRKIVCIVDEKVSYRSEVSRVVSRLKFLGHHLRDLPSLVVRSGGTLSMGRASRALRQHAGQE